MEREKYVDESWKDTVEQEKTKGGQPAAESSLQTPEAPAKDAQEPASPSPQDLQFFNYLASLGYQALIFLGEIPNPLTNLIDKNLPQAKFIIDTLVLLREKTKGNLSGEETNLLNGSLYELQMKYVSCRDLSGKPYPTTHPEERSDEGS